MPQQFYKDPDATLDYTIDWEDWLNGDTVSTSSWTVDSGLTKATDAKTTTATTVWVSGGTVGIRYKCVNEIVTANGRTDNRTIYITVQQK